VQLFVLRLVPAKLFENVGNFAYGFLQGAGVKDADEFPAILAELTQSRFEQLLIERVGDDPILGS